MKKWKNKIRAKTLKDIRRNAIFRMIIFIIAFIVVLFSIQAVFDEDETSFIEISDNNPSWNTYVNREYGFSIDFPVDWKVYEDFENVSPTINIYIPEKNITPPFDHFAEVNNVSIFPKGLPTEAVIGQYQETDVEFLFYSDKAIDYILDNGDVWATYINVDDFGDPWKDWGFVWSKVIIDDIKYKCLVGEREIDLDSCNPFEGDEFVRVGTVDPKIRATQVKIIESFRILPGEL